MKYLFIPYEQSLELKELGFDEQCLACYIELVNPNEGLLHIPFLEKEPCLKAPLWQQAFDWFRDKGLLNHLTTHLSTWCEDEALEESYGYRIMINKDGWKCDVWEELSKFQIYEEAKLNCLKKLIEILKNS